MVCIAAMPLAPGLRVILFEGEGAQPLTSAERLLAMTSLLEKGFSVSAESRDSTGSSLDTGRAIVLGRFSSPPPERSGTQMHNIAGLGGAEIAELVETARTTFEAPKQGEWKPWFPVIDYDRCTNCMQCLSFCLFGVYGVDEAGKIQAQNHDNCKTNCPACSRVCPEAAIMFPKYKSGPINGDIVSAEDLQREKMKIDISALLGGDVYSMLRERSDRAKSRFSKERDANKALNERQKCLVKLAQAGDIPAEVLMSLPAPDEIMRRAEEAKAKAQAALAMQPQT